MMLLDKVFDMESGYVLNFSDASMHAFYVHDLNVDIDAPEYRADGTSKAKRIRCFLRKVSDAEAARVLRVLWEYRQAMYLRSGKPDPLPNAESMFLSVMVRLEGKRRSQANAVGLSAMPANDWVKLSPLCEKLLGLVSMSPHPRGQAFGYIPSFWRHLEGHFHYVGNKLTAAFSTMGIRIF
ncbi:hypothetical protein [Dyella nitratireducens]|uniref:hypothetical protein n=1 Tax=Dyella nitratireducens TaxID=1849580 RepID=UPI001E533522|nr:hypothetical protein [Dyella nitratireducens]